jgi:hypothetical protein
MRTYSEEAEVLNKTAQLNIPQNMTEERIGSQVQHASCLRICSAFLKSPWRMAYVQET